MAEYRGKQFLLVCAHPDDETLFGGVIYKLTRKLGAKVDVIVITNGEGGFRYSTLGEYTYDKSLTDETVAREEMLDSATVLGIRDVYFLDEKDHQYTRDVKEILETTIWDCQHVINEIKRILTNKNYDYVFISSISFIYLIFLSLSYLMLPDTEQHAHHKLSCLFTLEVLQELKELGKQTPIVLAGTEKYEEYTAFPGYETITRAISADKILTLNIPSFVSNSTVVKNHVINYMNSGSLVFQFDRRQGFGAMQKLTYQIPVIWAASEHKSQGTVLFETLSQNYEYYWAFEHFTNEQQLVQIYNLFKTLNNELIN